MAKSPGLQYKLMYTELIPGEVPYIPGIHSLYLENVLRNTLRFCKEVIRYWHGWCANSAGEYAFKIQSATPQIFHNSYVTV